MWKVTTFDDLKRQIAEIRALGPGLLTNFFPNPARHGLWIEKGDCFTERVENSLFIVKKSPSFWSVFFCSANQGELGSDWKAFVSRHPGVTMVSDIVGREGQCGPLAGLLMAAGCRETASLVRMTRMTEPMSFAPDASVRFATGRDLPRIKGLLHQFFDERTEQLPYDEELAAFMAHHWILVCEEDGNLAGFLIFELSSATLYLRYWFTHPDFRGRKVGSRLMRRFFEEGKETRRQILWVMRTNGDAMEKYRHYGFVEEDMFDHVMQFD